MRLVSSKACTAEGFEAFDANEYSFDEGKQPYKMSNGPEPRCLSIKSGKGVISSMTYDEIVPLESLY